MTINVSQTMLPMNGQRKWYIGVGLDDVPINIDWKTYYDTEEEVVNKLRALGYTVKKERVWWNQIQYEYQMLPVRGWVVMPELHPSQMPSIWKKKRVIYDSQAV